MDWIKNDAKWIFIYENCEDLTKKAINTLGGFLNFYIKGGLAIKTLNAVSESELGEKNLVYVGYKKSDFAKKIINEKGLSVPSDSEGFSLAVGSSPYNEKLKIISVIANNEVGAFYGVCDLINLYFGSEIYKSATTHRYEHPEYFELALFADLKEWKINRAPQIKRRGAWTWGHVIYDYRKYLDNLANLKFNEVVIWNDYIPFNAKEVVNYAHSLNVKVIWGFTWGWELSLIGEQELTQKVQSGYLKTLTQKTVEKYESEYASANADGIYFQTFTENHIDKIGEKSMAQLVTEFVNDTASALWQKYPNLQIQFGLHATSVKDNLNELKGIDKKIEIIWEDCGAFPYSYSPVQYEKYSETMAFVDNILFLRGESENFGSVLKGMINLDWCKFVNQNGNYAMGHATSQHLNLLQASRERIWKFSQAEWIRNADKLKNYVQKISKNANSNIQILLEDSLMETCHPFPLALLSEMLWDCDTDALSTVVNVAKFPSVKFANF